MQCQEFQELLSAYLDGMLDPSVKDRAGRHLEECPVCRAEFDDLRMVVGLVRDLPQVEPPDGFRRNLRLKLENAAGQRRKDGFMSRLATGRWFGMVAAAACFFLVFGLAYAWYGLPGKYGTPGQPVQLGSYDKKESAAAPVPSSVHKGTDDTREMLSTTDKSGVTGSGAVLSERESKTDRPGEAVNTTSAGSQAFTVKALPPVNGPGLMQKRKLAVENGTAGVAARGVAAATSAPQAEQPKNAVIDIKVDPKNNDIRGTLEGIARKYNGTMAVLPETGGKEIIIKVPGTQFEKAVADIGKTGTVLKQDFNAQDAGVDFMMIEAGAAPKIQEADKTGKGGSGTGGAPPSGTVTPPGGNTPTQQTGSGSVMATIRVRLE